ncbi:MAG: hypothetical protein ACREMY_04345 [bacterium]
MAPRVVLDTAGITAPHWAPDGSFVVRRARLFRVSEPELTRRQAYDAAFLFLKEWWERGGRQSEDARWILSAMGRGDWNEDISNDPAMDHDWARCVQRILDGFDPYGDGMF